MTENANPPIHAVVLGIYFDRPPYGFGSEHIGFFWNRIKGDYGKVNTDIPFHSTGDHGLFDDDDLPFPMPRYSFERNDQTSYIHLQRNALIFDWHRKGNEPYPGFKEYIMPMFMDLTATFEDFLKQDVGNGSYQVARCELTYIDLVTGGDYWNDARDTSFVVPSFSPLRPLEGLDGDMDVNYRSRFRMADGLNLRVVVRTATKSDANASRGLIMEYNAAQDLGIADIVETHAWFNSSHDLITRAFRGLTNPEVRTRHWKLGGAE